ncbi:MFS transporter [Haliea atlantica]|jgi:MFS family permease|nr:MFS transporter [Haliea sp.]
MSGSLHWRQLGVLITALMATAIGQSLVFAILAPLGREVGMREVQITSIIACSSLCFALASPLWGRLSDRIGRKPVMIVGLVGYTLGTVLFTSVFWLGLAGILSGSLLYGAVIGSRCAQALIMSAGSPSATAYAADNSSTEQRTRTMARLGTANSLGTILGPAVSGALATLGLLAPLYFAAGLAALGALLVWRGLPPTPKRDRSAHQPRVRLSYNDPRYRWLLVSAVGVFVGFSGIQQTLGFLLQDKLQLTGIETAQMTGAALMVSAAFTFLVQMTVLQRVRLGPGQLIRLGLLALLFGAAIIAAADRFPLVAVGMAFMGTGLGLTMPSVSAGASLAVTPEEQGGVAGLVASCPPAGFIIGPLVCGALYQWHGPLAPLFSATVFFLTLVLLVTRDREGNARRSA